jgi:3-deoxy-D-manno-octulosonic-acid transferase
MPYLLNVVYLLLLVVGSPWLLYQAISKGKYREGYAAKFFGRVPVRHGDEPCVWLHAVSVGEVNLLGPLLGRLERQYPGWTFVISATTKTGLELARKKYSPRSVFYCPLDFTWAVRSAMKRIRPNLLVLAELELWPNLISAAQKQGAKVAVFNGRLSDRSTRGYRRIRPLVASVLRSLDVIAAQNPEYADRFRLLGARPETVHVTGSVKFDGAETSRENPITLRLADLAGIGPDDVVFLAGSTQEPEEAMALEVYREIVREYPQLLLIMTPRHPDRFEEVAGLLERSGVRWQRRSKLGEEARDPEARVLLIDTVGELGAWWGAANIAYVGGSMGKRGGQNMIEPAAYGAAVSFGPNTQNFRDVVALMRERQAAVVVQNADELVAFVRRCLGEPSFAVDLGGRARELVTEQLGAADRTCDLLRALMEKPGRSA